VSSSINSKYEMRFVSLSFLNLFIIPSNSHYPNSILIPSIFSSLSHSSNNSFLPMNPYYYQSNASNIFLSPPTDYENSYIRSFSARISVSISNIKSSLKISRVSTDIVYIVVRYSSSYRYNGLIGENKFANS